MNEQIERIQAMESCLDRALNAEKALHQALDQLEGLAAAVEQLEKYYSSSVWRQDFEADEQGLLPESLKRGVLSEDGVYNALEEYSELLRRMREAAGREPN